MPSGKGPGLQGAQRKFVENLSSEFLSKTKYGKVSTPGAPLPEDDKDLRTWVLARRGEFEVAFALELAESGIDPEKIRKSFDDFFKNRKEAAQRKWTKAAAKNSSDAASKGLASHPSANSLTPTKQADTDDCKLIWSSLLKGGTLTGRKLFDDEHRTAVSDEVNAIRKRDSIDSKQHVGLMNAKLKQMWDDLKTNQKDWEDRASALRESGAKDIIYKNQAVLADNISVLLSSVIGPTNEGLHKIGNARFHVLYAYRDEKERLRTGNLDITSGQFGESPTFEIFNPDYAPKVMKPWRECCLSTVRKNIVSAHPDSAIIFSYDEDGRPLLPTVDEQTITGVELKKMLIGYVKAHWAWVRSQADATSSMPSDIPWRDEMLKAFLTNTFKGLTDPASMATPALFQLLTVLQASEPTSNIFSLPSSALPTPLSDLATTTLQTQPPQTTPIPAVSITQPELPTPILLSSAASPSLLADPGTSAPQPQQPPTLPTLKPADLENITSSPEVPVALCSLAAPTSQQSSQVKLASPPAAILISQAPLNPQSIERGVESPVASSTCSSAGHSIGNSSCGTKRHSTDDVEEIEKSPKRKKSTNTSSDTACVHPELPNDKLPPPSDSVPSVPPPTSHPQTSTIPAQSSTDTVTSSSSARLQTPALPLSPAHDTSTHTSQPDPSAVIPMSNPVDLASETPCGGELGAIAASANFRHDEGLSPSTVVTIPSVNENDSPHGIKRSIDDDVGGRESSPPKRSKSTEESSDAQAAQGALSTVLTPNENVPPSTQGRARAMNASKKTKKCRNSAPSTRAQPLRSSTRNKEPRIMPPPKSTEAATDALLERPVFLSRTGKPLKDTKRWTYEAAKPEDRAS
ncbi:hypothetical protein CVT26_003257 [Gymnopilus dilepis]|uniref:Uncharacterized protein n=1 Tax=Gymnopilus dilepis TaxID=231916 RepID=A0A409Y4X9_9AGAR|nr:hypothetical protein CVT26_003257 [Gymnopilus dilepis]